MNNDLFIVHFSKIVNISAHAIFLHEMMGILVRMTAFIEE